MAACFVEVRIGKQPQTDDSGSVSVVRAHGHVFPARADLDAGIFLLVLERIAGTIGAARIQPQPEAVFARLLGLFEARFIDQTELLPARVPAQMLDARMGRKNLEQIHGTEALADEVIPETVITAGPNDPIVAPFDFVGRKSHRAVHVFEIIFIGRRKAFRRAPHGERLVFDGAGLRRFFAAACSSQHGKQSNREIRPSSCSHFFPSDISSARASAATFPDIASQSHTNPHSVLRYSSSASFSAAGRLHAEFMSVITAGRVHSHRTWCPSAALPGLR